MWRSLSNRQAKLGIAGPKRVADRIGAAYNSSKELLFTTERSADILTLLWIDFKRKLREKIYPFWDNCIRCNSAPVFVGREVSGSAIRRVAEGFLVTLIEGGISPPIQATIEAEYLRFLRPGLSQSQQKRQIRAE
jgi:hypothetical protein